jgi:hypothetical protein
MEKVFEQGVNGRFIDSEMFIQRLEWANTPSLSPMRVMPRSRNS